MLVPFLMLITVVTGTAPVSAPDSSRRPATQPAFELAIYQRDRAVTIRQESAVIVEIRNRTARDVRIAPPVHAMCLPVRSSTQPLPATPPPPTLNRPGYALVVASYIPARRSRGAVRSRSVDLQDIVVRGESAVLVKVDVPPECFEPGVNRIRAALVSDGQVVCFSPVVIVDASE